MDTSSPTQLYRHPTLDIAANKSYWHALGYTTYSNTDVVSRGTFSDEKDACLVIGLEETQANDHRPIVWAMKELQRRKEAKDQNTAVAQLATALHTIRVPADLDVAPFERAVDRLTSTLTQNTYRFERRSYSQAES